MSLTSRRYNGHSHRGQYPPARNVRRSAAVAASHGVSSSQSTPSSPTESMKKRKFRDPRAGADRFWPIEPDEERPKSRSRAGSLDQGHTPSPYPSPAPLAVNDEADDVHMREDDDVEQEPFPLLPPPEPQGRQSPLHELPVLPVEMPEGYRFRGSRRRGSVSAESDVSYLPDGAKSAAPRRRRRSSVISLTAEDVPMMSTPQAVPEEPESAKSSSSSSSSSSSGKSALSAALARKKQMQEQQQRRSPSQPHRQLHQPYVHTAPRSGPIFIQPRQFQGQYPVYQRPRVAQAPIGIPVRSGGQPIPGIHARLSSSAPSRPTINYSHSFPMSSIAAAAAAARSAEPELEPALDDEEPVEEDVEEWDTMMGESPRSLRRDEDKDLGTVSASTSPTRIADWAVTVPKSAEEILYMQESTAGSLLFSGLPWRQQQAVFDAMIELSVQAGHVVLRQGQELDEVYVVKSGRLESFSEVAGRRSQVTTYDGVGVFGEQALMYKSVSVTTVTAVTDVELWTLDRETFRRIIVESEILTQRDEDEDYLL